MSNFFPKELNFKDTASPLEILHEAKADLEKTSGGLLTLAIQETETNQKNTMLITRAEHCATERTVTLFSVIHRADKPYPANIQVREDELPDNLKKTYYKPSIADIAASMTLGGQGQKIHNPRVCDTPSEFRSKLRETFDLGTVKSEMISLLASKNKESIGSSKPLTPKKPPSETEDSEPN